MFHLALFDFCCVFEIKSPSQEISDGKDNQLDAGQATNPVPGNQGEHADAMNKLDAEGNRPQLLTLTLSQP